MATYQHNFKVKNGLTVENSAGNDSEIVLKDASATALVIKEGSTAYLTFDTSNSTEKIVFNKAVDFGGQTITNLPTAFTVTDGSNSSAIAGGGTLTVQGTANEVEVGESSGTLTVGLPNDVIITGNLTVNGTTNTINSTTMTVDDPIITLGGDTAPGSDDNKDRGVEYRWHDGSSARIGFFGMDDTDSKFAYIPQASNTSEVMSGTLGGAKFKNMTLSDLTDNRITIAGTSGLLEDDANFTFDGANMKIATTGSIQIPVGSTAQRPTAVQGQLRYNTDDSSFEGYDGSAWGSLGGVKDGDGDTTIIAEDSAGADNDELDFKTAGTVRMTIGATGDITYGDSLNKVTIAAATGNTVIAGTLDVTSAVNLNATTTSSSTTTGALIVDGGVGIAENVHIGGGLTVAGASTLNGNIDIGDANTDTLTITAKVDSSILPDNDGTRELGSASLRWLNTHTDNIKAQGYIDGVDYMDIDTSAGTPAVAEGRVFYENNFDALAYYTGDTSQIIRIGQNTFQYVYNDTGSTIAAGKAVRYSGGLTAGGMKVSLSDKSSTDVQHTIGLTFGSIANTGYGYVMIQGLYFNLDTSAFSVGAPLYVDSAGALTATSPTYPNFSVEVCKTTKSHASTGVVYVDMINNMAASFRTTGDARFDGDVVIGGNLTILGTSASTDVNSLNVEDPYIFLGAGDSIGTVNFSGSGLNDVTFHGLFEGTASTTYYVKIDGTGSPDTYSWSKDNFSSTEATGVSITGAEQALDNGIKVKFNATSGHTSADTWNGVANPANIDVGVVGYRNTGASGVGFTQVGLFFDVTDQKWKIFDEYDPALTGNLNTSDGSFSLGTLVATTFEGALTGNVTGSASTAAEAQTIHSIQRGAVDAAHYLAFVDSDDGSMAVNQIYTDAGVAYNPSSNNLTITGQTISGSFQVSGSTGVYFEGSTDNGNDTLLTATDPTANNTITLPNSTGTVALTSQLGNFVSDTGGSFTGDVTFTGDNYNVVWDKSDDAMEWADNAKATFGTDADLEVKHTGSAGSITNGTGNLTLETTTGKLYIINGTNDEDIILQSDDGSGGNTAYITCDGSAGEVLLTHYGTTKFATKSTGIELTGNITNSASGKVVHFGGAAVDNTSAVVNYNMRLGTSTAATVTYETDYNAGGESHMHTYYCQNNAVNGPLGRFDFYGHDDGGNDTMYAMQKFFIKGAADGSECGAYQLSIIKDDDIAGSGTAGLIDAIMINGADTAINVKGVNNGSFRIFGLDLYLQGTADHGYPNILLDTGTYDTAITATTGTAHRTITLPDASGTVLLAGTASSSADVQFDSFGVGTAASGTTGEIRATNDVTAFYSSDRNLKENIEVIVDPLGKITALRGVMFDWTDEHIAKRGGEDGYFVRKHDVGVIAQEVEEVLPEVVRQRDDGIKAVDYQKLTALLIEGMKEQQEQINRLTEQVSSLITNSSEK